MESFVKWGKEKRQLDEVLATTIAGGALAAGTASFLWQRGLTKKEQRGDFWVYNKRADEGDRKKVFKGIDIVKMVRTGELQQEDLVYPDGAQNWMTIKDAAAKKYLSFGRVTKGKAGDETVWWAYIDGKKVKFNSSKEFAQAIAKRDVEPDTLVYRNGYDDWMPYKHKDVQDDMYQYVEAEPPSLGEEKLFGAKTYYILNGKKVGPIKFEELGKEVKQGFVRDDSYVWVQGHSKDWVRFKTIKKMVPSVGQAHVASPRSGLSAVAKGIGKVGNWFTSNRAERDSGYLKAADDKDRAATD